MSLISHLITRFAPSAENVAVEALGYVLQASDVAADAMTRLLNDTGAGLPQSIQYRTQATSDDSGRPDLEGTVGSGEVLALIEAKFWAGLTDQQPITYLNRFKVGKPGVLMFLVPAKRFSAIWAEITGRCQAAGMPCGVIEANTPAEFWYARLPNGHRLAIVSWRLVLDDLTRALTQSGHLKVAGDLEQIRDLCDRMDEEAFIPLTADELSSQIVPRRQKQLFALANEIGDEAVRTGIGGTKNHAGEPLTKNRGIGIVGRYMRLGEADVFVGFDNDCWAKLGITPLWLWFPSSDKNGLAQARRCLASWRHELPPRLFELDGGPCVPLRLPVGREKSEVILHVLDQLRDIKTRLAEVNMGAAQ